MSKKIFIVFGHHNYKLGSSFNASARDTFIDEAKKNNHEIDLLNLYEESQLKFWDGSKPNEQILNYRKRLVFQSMIVSREDPLLQLAELSLLVNLL